MISHYFTKSSTDQAGSLRQNSWFCCMQQTGQPAHPCRLKMTASQVSEGVRKVSQNGVLVWRQMLLVLTRKCIMRHLDGVWPARKMFIGGIELYTRYYLNKDFKQCVLSLIGSRRTPLYLVFATNKMSLNGNVQTHKLVKSTQWRHRSTVARWCIWPGFALFNQVDPDGVRRNYLTSFPY